MKAKAVPERVTPPAQRYSLYRKATPAETSGVTHGVTRSVSSSRPAALESGSATSQTRPEAKGTGVAGAPKVAADGSSAPTRKADRHKEGQAAYMREYRERKKAKKAT